MAKRKTAFVCNECGAESGKWVGQCGECGAWNSVVEFRLPAESRGERAVGFAGAAGGEIKVLGEIELDELPRIATGAGEFDRVLGGGLVPGSAILIGGHPGAGKSTLLLQTLCGLAQTMTALYVTGEESLQQVAMRAQRLQLPADRLRVLAETDVHVLLEHVRKLQPRVLLVDSIQVPHNRAPAPRCRARR